MIRLHKYTVNVEPLDMKRISHLTYVTAVSAILSIWAIYYLSQTGIASTQTQTPSTLNATSVYDSGQMVLGNNVKHLVIVIPNEGHHGPGEEDESRFIAQPFLPQNALVGPGTQVAWFNGDVGHEHNIVVRDANGVQLFETSEFTELQASKPIVFNNTGEFEYADTVEYEDGFVMTGTIRVIDQGANNPTNLATFDTVGALMVPSMDIQNIATSIKNAGFGVKYLFFIFLVNCKKSKWLDMPAKSPSYHK